MIKAQRKPKAVSTSELSFHLLRATTCLILIVGCGALFDLDHGHGATALMGLFIVAAAVCVAKSVILLVRHGAEPIDYTPDPLDGGAT